MPVTRIHGNNSPTLVTIWSMSVTVRKGVNIGSHEIQYRATDVFGTSTIYSAVAKFVEETGDNGAIDSDVLSNNQLIIGLFILPLMLGVVFVLIGQVELPRNSKIFE